jgi:1-acyl-sn-glycerol-3-phosphate acyltransferase
MKPGYFLLRAFARGLFSLVFGLRIKGKRNIPLGGKLIIAANHRSNLDPLVVGVAMPREIHFFAKIELFRNRFFAQFIRYLNAFPVTRTGFDRQALSHSLKILERDEALLIFPEGTRAPAGGFLRAKSGIGWVASLSNSPIVPVYVHGSDHPFRAILRRPRIAAVIGKPIPLTELVPSSLEGKVRYQALAEEVLERIRTVSLETPGRLVEHKGPVLERDVIPEPHLR